MADMNNDNLSYWFLLLLPIVMGMMVAFAHLQSDFSETEALNRAQIQTVERDANLLTELIRMSDGEDKKAVCNQLIRGVTDVSEQKYFICKDDGAVEYDREAVERDSARRFLVVDLGSFLYRLSEGVAASVISIDIWALTTLLAYRPNMTVIPPYAYPTLGIILHFVLVLLVMAAGKLSYWGEPIRLSLALTFMLLSVAIGWLVRDKVWRRYEMIAGKNNGTED